MPIISFRKIGRYSSDRNIEGSGKIRFHDQKKGIFFNDQYNFGNYKMSMLGRVGLVLNDFLVPF